MLRMGIKHSITNLALRVVALARATHRRAGPSSNPSGLNVRTITSVMRERKARETPLGRREIKNTATPTAAANGMVSNPEHA